MATVFQPERRILCIYYSQLAYLFSTMRPATNSVLLQSPAMVSGFKVQSTLNYYAKSGIQPDVVFIVKKLPIGKGPESEPLDIDYLSSDPLYRKVTGAEYRSVINREHYSLHLLN